MKEGIYIKQDLFNGQLYTGFILYYNRGLQVATFTSCSMDFITNQIAIPKIKSINPIPIYRVDRSDIKPINTSFPRIKQ